MVVWRCVGVVWAGVVGVVCGGRSLCVGANQVLVSVWCQPRPHLVVFLFFLLHMAYIPKDRNKAFGLSLT